MLFRSTSFSPLMQKCDNYAADCNTKGIDNMLYLGLGLRSLLYGVVGFSVVYFGTAGADFIVRYLPENVIDGMAIAGRMMPAVGFAMLLRTMFNVKLLPYFFLGFLLTTYMQLPIMAVAIAFLCIAILDYYHQESKGNDASNSSNLDTINDEL